MPGADLIDALTQLIPGFLALEFYLLFSPRRRPAAITYIVQALILTVLIGAGSGLYGGSVMRLPYGLLTGILLLILERSDAAHKLMRLVKLSSLSARPSPWFDVFANHPSYVVLHLQDGRRITGWPRDYCKHYGDGHVKLEHSAWLIDDGSQLPTQSPAFLVESGSIQFVEVLRMSRPPSLQSTNLTQENDRESGPAEEHIDYATASESVFEVKHQQEHGEESSGTHESGTRQARNPAPSQAVRGFHDC